MFIIPRNYLPSWPPDFPQSYSLPHYSFIKVYACEHYEDDPYSSFAFGGDHRCDVDFGLATPIHMGGQTKPTLQMSANRAQRVVRNHLEKDFDWGKYMMDANGLLPLEGFLSDIFSVPLYIFG